MLRRAITSHATICLYFSQDPAQAVFMQSQSRFRQPWATIMGELAFDDGHLVQRSEAGFCKK